MRIDILFHPSYDVTDILFDYSYIIPRLSAWKCFLEYIKIVCGTFVDAFVIYVEGFWLELDSVNFPKLQNTCQIPVVAAFDRQPQNCRGRRYIDPWASSII